MKKIYFTLAGFIVLFCACDIVTASVFFNDGGFHVVDYDAGSILGIDWDAPTAGTRVEFTDGAQVDLLQAKNHAQVTITGGRVNPDVYLRDYATLDMSGGRTSLIGCLDSSRFTLTNGIAGTVRITHNSKAVLEGGTIRDVDGSGDGELIFDGCSTSYNISISSNFKASILSGSIGDDIITRNDSVIEISGGIIEGYISVGEWQHIVDNAQVILKGTDFMINGSPAAYGTYTVADYTNGHITATLSNGDPLNNNFYIYDNSTLILIPEPASALLLIIGAGLLRVGNRR